LRRYTRPRRKPRKTEQALLKLEHEWADAYVRRDVAALDRIEADDSPLRPDRKVATKKDDIKTSSRARSKRIDLVRRHRVAFTKDGVITGLQP